MLREEELILVAVVVGFVVLVLGILELIWPSRPRHPVRRPEPARAPTAIPTETVMAARAAWAKTATRVRRSQVSPHARAHAGPADRVWEREPLPASLPPVPLAPLREPVVAAEAPPAPRSSSSPEPAAAATRPIDLLLVERCFILYVDRRYDEAVSVGEEALARLRDTPLSTPDASDAAALWSVVALAKQALGDDVGACLALESALGVAPADQRTTYQQHIAALSHSAARTALARGGSHDAGDPVSDLRRALAWSERGLGAVPSDARLREMRETACAELWSAYDRSVHKLLQRQEFRAARRLLREALEDPEIPTARVESFEDLLSVTSAGEIGQLTAHAIRSMQEARESEALAALRRAEALLVMIPDEALPPHRREELEQRLWWGYTRLGVRRVEAGDHEDALDPLIRALKVADISPDRRAETRAALVRALEGVADRRPLSIRQLDEAGDRGETVLGTETLRERLQSCMELGLSADELSVAFAKIQRLCEELGVEVRA